MKKMFLALAFSSVSAVAMADGLKFFPLLTDPSFRLEPAVAATVGSVKPQGAGSETAYGVEVNFNCGLMQTPDNRMQTHLSVSHINGDSYDALTVDLSPRYTLPLGSGFSVGVGPSIGMARINPDLAGVSDETFFTYGLVGGLNYRSGALYAGLDLGLRNSREKNGMDVDSHYATFKLGVYF